MTLPDPIADPAIDPRDFWAAVTGVRQDQLIVPPGPSPLMHRWTRWRRTYPRLDAFAARTQRLWRIFWFGPHHPDPPSLPVTPLNLAPWTNRLLPHPDETGNRIGLVRLYDRSLWHLSHPATRFETHAWRCKARAEAPLSGRLHCLRRTLTGQPPGPPPWLEKHLTPQDMKKGFSEVPK